MVTADYDLSVSHATDAEYVSPESQPYFTIRDLGVASATGGKIHAQIVRASNLSGFSGQARHTHAVSFHFVYLIRGWATCEFEGKGIVTMRAGSAWLQPGGQWHAVKAVSDDFEALEIVSPPGATPNFVE